MALNGEGVTIKDRDWPVAEVPTIILIPKVGLAGACVM